VKQGWPETTWYIQEPADTAADDNTHHTSPSRHTTGPNHLCSFTLHRHVKQPDPSSVLIHASPSRHTTRPIIRAHSRFTITSHSRTHHLCSFTLHRHVTQPDPSSVLIHASPSRHTTGPVICAHSRSTVTSNNRDPSSVLIRASPSCHKTGRIICAHSRSTVTSHNPTHRLRSFALHRHVTQPDPSSVLIHTS